MTKKKVTTKKKPEVKTKTFFTSYHPGMNGSLMGHLADKGFNDLSDNAKGLAEEAREEIDDYWSETCDGPKPDTYYEVQVTITLSEPKKLPKPKVAKPKDHKVVW